MTSKREPGTPWILHCLRISTCPTEAERVVIEMLDAIKAASRCLATSKPPLDAYASSTVRQLEAITGKAEPGDKA